MTRLNWDRIRKENLNHRQNTMSDSIASHPNKTKVMSKETYVSRLEAKGREYVETTSNKVVAEFLGCNPGHASNVRKTVAERNGWTLSVARAEQSNKGEPASRQRKPIGCLPLKTQAWIKAQLGLEPDDDLPEGFGSDDLFALPAVRDDSLKWNRHIHKLGGYESEFAISLRQWAGRPLTVNQADQEEALQEHTEKMARRKKAVALLYKAAAEADTKLKLAILILIEQAESEENQLS